MNRANDRSLKPRRPGRPRAGSGDQRERLIDAALGSFADTGIAATSLRALARKAKLTPAMVNYYFGSKDRLVEAVVSERLMPVIAELKQRMAENAAQTADAMLLSFVAGVHESMQQHPWLPSLWVREVLSEGGHLRRILIERIAPEIALPLSSLIRDAQARGEINPALDPRLLFVSLIGLTIFPYAAAPIWRRVFDAADVDAQMMLSHTAALLTDGMKVHRGS